MRTDQMDFGKKMQDDLNANLHRFGVPGATFAVLRDNKIAQASAGVINLRTQVETTPDTVFQIGSITKLLTGALVMQLVQEGVLDLDDPVRDHLPEFALADPTAASRITVAHLLSHGSGIDGDFFEDTGRGFDAIERYLLAMRALPMLHEPGAGFSYCNAGFVVLGRLIEKYRRKHWHEVIRERVFKPLEMKSFGSLPEQTLHQRAAIGHIVRANRPGMDVAPTPFLQFSNAPAGATPFGSAEDLLKFAKALLFANERFLARHSIDQMWRPLNPVPLQAVSLADAFGLTFMLWHQPRLVVGHDGATVGQYAFLRVVPECRFALVLLTNGGRAGDLFRELADPLLRRECGVAVPPAVVASASGIAVPAHNFALDAYLGVYEKLSARIEVGVGVGPNSLSAVVTQRRFTVPAQTYVLHASDHAHVFASTSNELPDAHFSFVSTGSYVRGLYFGGRLYPRLQQGNI